jgi:hypothetical protein
MNQTAPEYKGFERRSKWSSFNPVRNRRHAVQLLAVCNAMCGRPLGFKAV